MGTFRIVSVRLGFEPEAVLARLSSCGLKIEKTLNSIRFEVSHTKEVLTLV